MTLIWPELASSSSEKLLFQLSVVHLLMLGLSVAQSMGAAHTAVIRVHKNVCAGYTRRTRSPTQCLHRTKHARLMSAVWDDTEFLDSVCNEALFQQVNARRILFFLFYLLLFLTNIIQSYHIYCRYLHSNFYRAIVYQKWTSKIGESCYNNHSIFNGLYISLSWISGIDQ